MLSRSIGRKWGNTEVPHTLNHATSNRNDVNVTTDVLFRSVNAIDEKLDDKNYSHNTRKNRKATEKGGIFGECFPDAYSEKYKYIAKYYI